MRKSLWLLLVLSAQTAAAEDSLFVNRVPVGVTLDSTVVMAECQSFGRRIDGMTVSPRNDYLLLRFRETTKSGKWLKNKGEIGVFGVRDRKLRWTHPVNYMTSSFYCVHGGVLVSEGGKVRMLDEQTGAVRWQASFYPVQFDDSVGVVLGYPSPTSSKLGAYDMETGMSLWTARLSHNKNWGWNHVIREDSVHLLIVADDVNRLDVRTGEIHSYEAKNGVDDVKGALLQGLMIAGAATAGAVMGTYAYPYGFVDNHVITGLHSNILSADSCYYFADRQKVVCLDQALRPVWQSDLPPKTAAHSYLFSNDTTLYMFSMGYGLENGQRMKKMGRPFIAAFDIHTGACRLMNMLSMRKDIVEDAVLSTDGVFMLFDDGLAYKSDLNDSTVSVTPWDSQANGRLRSLITRPVYAYYHLKSMFDLVGSDGTYFPVMTDRGDLYLVDRQLRIGERFPSSSLYFPVFQIGDRMCIARLQGTQDVWIVQEQGIPEIHLTAHFRHAGFAENTLCLQNERILMLLPLE